MNRTRHSHRGARQAHASRRDGLPGKRATTLASTALLALLILPATGDARRLADKPDEGSVDQRVESTCRRISGRLASVSLDECRAAELRTSGHESVQGVPILVRDVEPPPDRLPPIVRELLHLRPLAEPGRILLVGACHGDELSSASIVFKWLRRLDDQRDLRFEWRIAPVMNPDGLFERRRVNANGVDLNRNFPSPSWESEAQRYWIERTGRNPRRYPGERPLSEPESRWLVEEIDRFDPHVIVSVHAPYNNVDFDGPPDPPERLGPLQLKLLGTYPGSLGRYAGVHRSIPVVTIELPSAGIMPSEEDQTRIWRDLLDYLADKVGDQRSGRFGEIEVGATGG